MAKRKQPNQTQYQIKTEPPYRFLTAVPRFEWRTPWSTPPTQMGAKSKQFGAAHIAGIGVTQPPTQFITAVPRFEWRQPWSIPAKMGRAIAVSVIASGLFAPVFTPVPKTDWLTPLSTPTPAKRGLHPSLHDVTADVYPVTTETITVDKWFSSFADVVRPKHPADERYQGENNWEAVAASMEWFTPLTEPVRLRQFAPSQQQPFTSSPLPYVSFSWFKDLSEPTRLRRAIAPDQPFVATTTTEVVTVDKWFDPLSEPARIKPFNAALQAAYTTEYFPDTPNANAGLWLGSFAEPLRVKSRFSALQAVFTIGYSPETIGQWFNPLSEPARTKRSLNAPDQSWVPFVATETVTVDKWFDPLSEPVRVKPALRVALQPVSTQDTVFIPNPSQYMEGWSSGLAEPVRQKLGLNTALQSAYTTGYFSFEIITVDKWYASLSDPKRFRPALHVSLQQTITQDTVFIPSPSRYEGWYGALSEPQRQQAGLKAAQQVPYCNSYVNVAVEVITVDKWFSSLSSPTKPKPGDYDHYKGENEFTAIAANMKWYAPLTEPVRQRQALATANQQAYFSSLAFTAAEVVTVDKWFKSYADLVRKKVPTDDRYLGENNWTVIAASMQWFAPFTEPVRTKPGLVPATRPPFFASPAVIIIPSLASWWRPLAEPPKAKVSLSTHLQQVFTQDPKLFPNPARFLEGWYNWFSEPVRHLAQLNAALQRSWTASDRRPVLATITVTMAATEINDDVALFAVKVLAGNPPATAVVSLTEIGHGASLTSIVEEGDDGSGTSVVES